MKRLLLLTASAALTACSARTDMPASNNLVVVEGEEMPSGNAAVTPPVAPPRPEENDAAPEREIVSEGPIDPKSGQGAAQVVQTYFALVEAKKFDEAKKLWRTDAAQAPDLSGYREYHAEVFKPDPVEGAAGSSYVTVPIRAYGITAKGEKFEEPQVVTLRRVNDIEGSTAEQRRWHIVRIDTPPSPH